MMFDAHVMTHLRHLSGAAVQAQAMVRSLISLRSPAAKVRAAERERDRIEEQYVAVVAAHGIDPAHIRSAGSVTTSVHKFYAMPKPPPTETARFRCGWVAAGMALARGERPGAPPSKNADWCRGWRARVGG